MLCADTSYKAFRRKTDKFGLKASLSSFRKLILEAKVFLRLTWKKMFLERENPLILKAREMGYFESRTGNWANGQLKIIPDLIFGFRLNL